MEAYLKRGGGLLVSFQMRLANRDFYGFLPEEYELKGTNRINEGESPKDGRISRNNENDNHVLLLYPNVVNEDKINEHCLHNDNVEGVYWTYLEPQHIEKYDVILEDKQNKNRKLLIVSKETLGTRIVVTSLSLDWQMHTELLANVIEYVVRGRPTVGILRKKGVENFEFKYLISSYESSKLSYTEYNLEKLNSEKIAIHIHDILIIDTAWDKREVSDFIAKNRIDIEEGRYKVITFETSIYPTYSIISSYKNSQAIISTVLVWLQSIYNANKPYWQDSFWRTYDVLYAFQYFKIPIKAYGESIGNELKKHDKNGSYDEVLGATCAMFQIYNWLFNDKNNSNIVRTRQWIQNNLYSKTLFERATAYDILISNGVEINKTKKENLKKAIEKQLLGHNNEFPLYRYCKTLYVCGYLNEALKIVEKLSELQDRREGKWINLSHTAAILDLLLDLYKESNRNNSSEIEKMILKGIEYIKSHYEEKKKSWHKDASVSAKCIVVLDKFEKFINLPIDLVLADSENSLKAISINKILKAAMKNNITYLQSVYDANEQREAVGKEVLKLKSTVNKLTLWNLIFGGICCTVGCLILYLLIYINEKKLLDQAVEFLSQFFTDNLKNICLAVLSLMILFFIYHVVKCKKLPNWLRFILRQKIKISENKDTGD